MPQLLVTVKQARWRKPSPAFVQQGDVPSDCLGDLKTTGHCLSVWVIEDDKSNLERVVTALAANRPNIDVIDYLLFDEIVISQGGFKVRQTAGDTPDPVANAKWHRDLVDLTGRTLVELASAIHQNSPPATRCLPKKVKQLVKESVERNEVDPKKLKAGVASELKLDPSLSMRIKRLLRDIQDSSATSWRRFRQG